jgi:hypothetical protein
MPRTLPIEPRFTFQRVGNEVAVYDSQSGAVSFLNQTAADILERIQAGNTVESIAVWLHGQYPEVGLDRARGDVVACCQQLFELGLISRPPKGNQDGDSA